MKLRELVGVVAEELEAAGLEQAGASLSLAFSAKRDANGRVSCEFVNASSLSTTKTGELHRLEVALPGRGANTRSGPPKNNEAERPEPSDGNRFLDGDELDTPAIFRIKLAEEALVEAAE